MVEQTQAGRGEVLGENDLKYRTYIFLWFIVCFTSFVLDGLSFFYPGDFDNLASFDIMFRTTLGVAIVCFAVKACRLMSTQQERESRSEHFGLVILVFVAFFIVCVRLVVYIAIDISHVVKNDKKCSQHESRMYGITAVIFNIVYFVRVTAQMLPLWFVHRLQRDVTWTSRGAFRAILLLIAMANFKNWLSNSFLDVQREFTDCYEGTIFNKSAWEIFDRITFPFAVFYAYQSAILFLIAFFEM